MPNRLWSVACLRHRWPRNDKFRPVTFGLSFIVTPFFIWHFLFVQRLALVSGLSPYPTGCLDTVTSFPHFSFWWWRDVYHLLIPTIDSPPSIGKSLGREVALSLIRIPSQVYCVMASLPSNAPALLIRLHHTFVLSCCDLEGVGRYGADTLHHQSNLVVLDLWSRLVSYRIFQFRDSDHLLLHLRIAFHILLQILLQILCLLNSVQVFQPTVFVQPVDVSTFLQWTVSSERFFGQIMNWSFEGISKLYRNGPQTAWPVSVNNWIFLLLLSGMLSTGVWNENFY